MDSCDSHGRSNNDGRLYLKSQAYSMTLMLSKRYKMK